MSDAPGGTSPPSSDGPRATIEDFQRLDLRVGTVLSAEPLRGARVPAITLQVDFGPDIGVKQSSAQLTRRYAPGELVGRQVVAVVNFPPRRVAGFRSDVLVLGALPEPGVVLLLAPDETVPDGTQVG